MRDALNAIDVLEACYRLDADDETWLAGIVETVARALGGELGAFAVADDGAQHTMRFSRTFDPSWLNALATSFIARFSDAENAGSLAGTARALAPLLAGRSTAMSALPSFSAMMPSLSVLGGARDLYMLNGFRADGHGLSLAIPLSQRAKKDPQRDVLLSRITTHLAASHRLRSRSRDALPEGVLDERGDVVDATSEAVVNARDSLRRAAMRLSAARGKHRRDEALATSEWTGLVAARWTLVDGFEIGGRRHLVLRENEIDAPSLDLLTDRERQVLALGAAGLSNKEIAYELGVDASTVRVLMARAADKLGARGRGDAIARYQKRTR